MGLDLWPQNDPVVFSAHGLRLREWSFADIDAMVALFNTDQMNRWTPLPFPFTPRVAQDYVKRAHRSRRDSGTLQLAIVTGDDAPIGELLLFPKPPDTVELAYAIGAAHQGRGVARRAVLAGIDIAFQSGIRRAVLTIAIDNEPSAAVATASGFHRTELPLRELHRKGFRLLMATWERLL